MMTDHEAVEANISQIISEFFPPKEHECIKK